MQSHVSPAQKKHRRAAYSSAQSRVLRKLHDRARQYVGNLLGHHHASLDVDGNGNGYVMKSTFTAVYPDGSGTKINASPPFSTDKRIHHHRQSRRLMIQSERGGIGLPYDPCTESYTTGQPPTCPCMPSFFAINHNLFSSFIRVKFIDFVTFGIASLYNLLSPKPI